MIEINLIPDVKLELIKARRNRNTIITGAMITSVVVIGLVVVLAINVFAVQWGRGLFLDGQIDNLKEEIDTKTPDLSKILTIQDQLSKISELNDSKLISSRIFDTISTVGSTTDQTKFKINDVTIDTESKKITINAEAENGYSDVEIYKKTIMGVKVNYTDDENNKQTPVNLAEDISLTNTSFGLNSDGNNALQFTLSFTYPDALFLPTSKNLKLVQESKGNVTDSYLGMPAFSERVNNKTEDE